MVIRSVRHRRLLRLIERNNPRYLRQNPVDRVRKVLTVLILTEHIDRFVAYSPPGCPVHRLSADRRD